MEESEIQSAKEDIFKRLDKRKENLEQQRSANISERSKNAAENQATLNKLNDWSNDILARVHAISPQNGTDNNGHDTAVKGASISEEDHSAMLASLSEEIQKFDTFFNEKSHDLSPYDVRQTQVISVQIKEKFVALQDTLKPKKKFGFKSKYKKNASNKSDGSKNKEEKAIAETISSISVSNDENDDSNIGSYEIKNPDGCNLIEVPSKEIEARDVIMNKLRNETVLGKIVVRILGSPGTLHITNMDNVTVLCGPVRTSIFVENCINCDFVVACQQLRIHTTRQSNFYLHVTSKAIIEDCHSVGFAPYSLSYTQLDDDFSKSGLSKEINNWNNIDDFNWLSTEKRSPNWHILEENYRKNNWLL